MKRVLLSLAVIFLFSAANAQRVYFVYLQSESNAPFFVKMANKIYSSSASGYLILSNLKDSTYNISLGFPASTADELKFTLLVNHSDKGFLVKKFEEGFALFDLQDLTVLKPQEKKQAVDGQRTVKRDDDFTKLLAKAVDDESLLTEVIVEKQKDVAKKDIKVEPKPQDVAAQPAVNKEEKKPDAPPAVDIVQTVTNDTPKQESNSAPVQSTPVSTTDVVKQDQPVETKEEKIVAADNKPSEKQQETTAKVQPTVTEPKEDKVIPAVIVNTQPIGETKQPESEPSKQDEPKQDQTDQTINESNPESLQAYKKSIVSRKSESSTTEGFGLVFLDKQEDVTDTIRLLIPNPKVQLVSNPVQSNNTDPDPVQDEKKEDSKSQTTNEVKTDNSDQKAEDKKQEENSDESNDKDKVKNPLSNLFNKKKDKDKEQGELKDASGKNNDAELSKSSCRSTASENDFLKLRRNMAFESDEESMIDVARKYFKSKCYSTEQIKHLSALFLTEESKFYFFDLGYKHVHDRENFSSLESELKEEYFIKRFKALIGE